MDGARRAVCEEVLQTACGAKVGRVCCAGGWSGRREAGSAST